jgi:hypothetical protein
METLITLVSKATQVSRTSMTADNIFNRLHYQVLTMLLVLGAVLMKTSEFTGSPIKCHSVSVEIYHIIATNNTGFHNFISFKVER